MGRCKLSSVSHATIYHVDHQLTIYNRVSPASDNRWEKNTWPELARLASDVPEAGIHFQGTFLPLPDFLQPTTNRNHRRNSLQPQQRRPSNNRAMVQRTPLHQTLVRLRSPQIPRPLSLRTTSFSRLRHSLHVRLYQHRHLPPLSCLPMSQEWCNHQPCHHLAYQ